MGNRVAVSIVLTTKIPALNGPGVTLPFRDALNINLLTGGELLDREFAANV